MENSSPTASQAHKSRANNPVILQMKNIEKQFPGVKALDNVSLDVKAGTVHALMGETVRANPR